MMLLRSYFTISEWYDVLTQARPLYYLYKSAVL